ncbi:unnamed protein product [Closterium sp. Naga37s-1]|nr:unnamed protein product [Closterium sp. Naga37s-1]
MALKPRCSPFPHLNLPPLTLPPLTLPPSHPPSLSPSLPLTLPPSHPSSLSLVTLPTLPTLPPPRHPLRQCNVFPAEQCSVHSLHGSGITSFQQGKAHPIPCALPLSLMLTNTRVPRSTRALVSGVGARLAAHADSVTAALQAMHHVALQVSVPGA